MKKSILALAVAAALAAPLAAQADTILYGSARVSVDYINDKFPGNTVNTWDVVNDDSRLGVQGSEDLGGGLSAIYQYEFGVDVTDGGNFKSNRPKFVGLKGNWGSFTLGTQETPYYGVTGVTDIFNSSYSFGATAWLGGSFNGYTLSPEGGGRGTGALSRLENSVLYNTPDFNGFSASVMLSMDGSRNSADGWSNGVDIWNINAKYSNGPFFAGVTYIAVDGEDNISLNGTPTFSLDLDQWAIGLGYNSGPFSLGFIYENGDYNEWGLIKPLFNGLGVNADKAWNSYLTGSYTFGNNVISAAYGQLNTGVSGQQTMDNYVVGYQYNFSKRTRVWAEYIGRSVGDNNLIYSDQNLVSIGTRVDF
ncbi:MAG: porin [Candidatus Competibacteraceae bacterium]|nr:porin [Candidatus Competibacteraceae bacterium]